MQDEKDNYTNIDLRKIHLFKCLKKSSTIFADESDKGIPPPG
jgi:hypothetical protein